MVDEEIDPTTELEQIRKVITAGKRKPYRKSKLDKFRAELVSLREHGASLAELQAWLRIKKRVKTERSTISRYLVQLSALGGNDG